MTIIGAINKTRKLLKKYKRYDFEDPPLISARVEFKKFDQDHSLQTECCIYISGEDESFDENNFDICFKKMIEHFDPPKVLKKTALNQSDKIK